MPPGATSKLCLANQEELHPNSGCNHSEISRLQYVRDKSHPDGLTH